MKSLDHIDTLQELCRATGRPGLYFRVNTPADDICVQVEETLKAAPWLRRDDEALMQCLMDGSGYLLFDSEAEMWDIFEQTVGDDGPTERNPYRGVGNVYAITCYANGELGTENT